MAVKSQSIGKAYDEAIEALNGLQRNAAVIEKSRREIQNQGNYRQRDNLHHVAAWLKRSGLDVADLDKLNAIHVSGTKGKGSVCAMCERVLRSHGYTTGFYSSPHLVEVRERIRINGRPLSKHQFTEYFWRLYKRLETTRCDMPEYTRFLTIMAFHVFLGESVAAVVLEVGMGGSFDCTNIIRSPVVTGTTSLGLDHTHVLGPSIEDIAWHKAGIYKVGAPAFSVPQDAAAFSVLRERAIEVGARLYEVPGLREYATYSGEEIVLGLAGKHQEYNASLALQLTKTFMEAVDKTGNKLSEGNKLTQENIPGGDIVAKGKETAVNNLEKVNNLLAGNNIKELDILEDGHKQQIEGNNNLAEGNTLVQELEEISLCAPFMLNGDYLTALRHCEWLGRNQTICKERITYYLDGAHTAASMAASVDWFKSVAEAEASGMSAMAARVLVFNYSGDRSGVDLMTPLLGCAFTLAVFCPNVVSLREVFADSTNYTVDRGSEARRVVRNEECWKRMGGCDSTRVFRCVEDALLWVSEGRNSDLTIDYPEFSSLSNVGANDTGVDRAGHIQCFIVGSLYLVGNSLKVLMPQLKDAC